MNSVIKKVYFHREKEDNWGLEVQLKKKNFNVDNILWFGSEVEIGIEFFEDGANKVISIQGKDVSDKNISI